MKTRHAMIHTRLIILLLTVITVPFSITVSAQQDGTIQRKLSPMLRELTTPTQSSTPRLKTQPVSHITALIKATDEETLISHGCHILANWDDLYIADMPTASIAPLASEHTVTRIEANAPASLCNDTTRQILGVDQIHTPPTTATRAYTGKGVVTGIMDTGFDFTHPTFSDRITRFWDMLASDTLGGEEMGLGREYIGNDAIKAIQHSYDGECSTHGTHTTGTMAGGGYEGHYMGMAPESEIVAVCNVTTNNQYLLSDEKRQLYTTATDILGFKYIFDYAEREGKPCVINLSEGKRDDPYQGMLYVEAMEKITGPGKILVASIGNEAQKPMYAHKDRDTGQMEMTVFEQNLNILYYVQTDGVITPTLGIGDTTLVWKTETILAEPDSMLIDTLQVTLKGEDIVFRTCACIYPDCWGRGKTIYEIGLKCLNPTRPSTVTTIGIDGRGTDAEIYLYTGFGLSDNIETTHSTYVPGSLPSVIGVGATGYRTQIDNYNGETKKTQTETGGLIADYSGRGPTMDGRIKPDIVAPGNNIISSYSSFYEEARPWALDIEWDTERFTYDGRTYAWNASTGTSMATPAVAGIIALWLEAKPDLTRDDIIDIFQATARHTSPDITAYPNNAYGYGEIDAYRGLLYILGIDGIVSPHELSGDILPLRDGESMKIYTIGGKKVQEMTPGHVYAIEIDSPDLTRKGSMLIRK